MKADSNKVTGKDEESPCNLSLSKIQTDDIFFQIVPLEQNTGPFLMTATTTCIDTLRGIYKHSQCQAEHSSV